MFDSYLIQKYVAAVTSARGINVVWGGVDQVPCVDGTTMYLPTLPEPIDKDKLTRLRRWVSHESAHVAYSEFSGVTAQGLLAIIENAIEDHRVDFLNISMYEGDKWVADADMELWAASVRDKAVPEDSRTYIGPLLSWSYSHSGYMPRGADWAEFLADQCNEKGAAYLEKLLVGDYGDVLKSIRTIRDKAAGYKAVSALADRILKEVFEQDPEDYRTPPEGGEGTAEGSDGGGEGGDDGKGEKGDGDGDEVKRIIEVDYTGAPVSSEHKVSKTGINLNLGELDTWSSYTPAPLSEHKVYSFKGTSDEPCGRVGMYTPDITDVLRESCGFANKVRTLLQVKSRDRWEYGKKSGKLNKGQLWKVASNAPHHDKVFKKQLINDTLDTAVSVLVDCSGSMSGDKYTHACAAAALLSNAIGNVLHIPTEVIGFTETHENVVEYIFRDFNTRMLGDEEFVRRCDKAGGMLLDNVDGESLVFAASRLLERKEKRKLLIVLSDGSPCGGRGKGSTVWHTKHVLEQLEKMPVDVVGVGIMHPQVAKFYKQHVIINNVSELDTALVSILSSKLL